MVGTCCVHTWIAAAAYCIIVELNHGMRQWLRGWPELSMRWLKVASHVRSTTIFATAALTSQGQLKPGVGFPQFVSQHSMTGCVNPGVLYFQHFRRQVRVKFFASTLVHVWPQGLKALKQSPAVVACGFSRQAVPGGIEAAANQLVCPGQMGMQLFRAAAGHMANFASQLGKACVAVSDCLTSSVNHQQGKLRPHCALVDVLEHRMAIWTGHFIPM